MIRITADLDYMNKLKVAYYFLKALIFIKRVKEIKINPSPKKGYHLEIFTSYPYTLREHFYLRKKIGDDLHRLSMDRLRHFGRNTLFYKKENLRNTDLI